VGNTPAHANAAPDDSAKRMAATRHVIAGPSTDLPMTAKLTPEETHELRNSKPETMPTQRKRGKAVRPRLQNERKTPGEPVRNELGCYKKTPGETGALDGGGRGLQGATRKGGSCARKCNRFPHGVNTNLTTR
jgi:hypothetical protein